MIDSDCAYKTIYNYLKGKDKFKEVVYDPDLEAQEANAAANSKRLKFKNRDCMTIEALREELYHMYQYRYLEVDDITPWRNMVEYEYALFADINRFVRYGGNVEMAIEEKYWFFCGKVDRGPDVEYKMGTNAPLTPWPAEFGIVKKATKPNEFAVEPVAFLHTHTPLTFSPKRELERIPVGPSQEDRNWAKKNKMLGLVYDYKPIKRGGIVAGHDLNAPATIISFGPERGELSAVY